MFLKYTIIGCLSLLISLVLSAPVEESVVPIISHESQLSPDGSFKWNYESGDGTLQHQTGTVEQLDKEHVVEKIKGDFKFVDPDGGTHQISYTADENGYVAEGGDIPIPPPIPDAIVKALEWSAAHPAPIETISK